MRISKFWLKDKFIIFFGHCVSQLSKAVQEEPSGEAGPRNTNEAYYSTATMLFFGNFVQKLFETNLNLKYQQVKVLNKHTNQIFSQNWHNTIVPLLIRISYFLLLKNEIHKIEKILKSCLDSIPSPSPSIKIQIMGGKVCSRRKGKTLLGVVNKLLKTKSLLTSPSLITLTILL